MKTQRSQCQQTINPEPSVRDGEKIVRTMMINSPLQTVYETWRDLENLPRFMKNLDSVTVRDQSLSHWVMRTKGGNKIEWDSEIIADRANEMISWRSLPNSDIGNAGSVWFKAAPDGFGTLVTVEINFQMPGGPLGGEIAKVFGVEPATIVEEDLVCLKCLLETGSIPSVNPHWSIFATRSVEG